MHYAKIVLEVKYLPPIGIVCIVKTFFWKCVSMLRDYNIYAAMQYQKPTQNYIY